VTNCKLTCSCTGIGEDPRICPADLRLPAGTSWEPRFMGTDNIPGPGITLLCCV